MCIKKCPLPCALRCTNNHHSHTYTIFAQWSYFTYIVLKLFLNCSEHILFNWLSLQAKVGKTMPRITLIGRQTKFYNNLFSEFRRGFSERNIRFFSSRDKINKLENPEIDNIIQQPRDEVRWMPSCPHIFKRMYRLQTWNRSTELLHFFSEYNTVTLNSFQCLHSVHSNHKCIYNFRSDNNISIHVKLDVFRRRLATGVNQGPVLTTLF